MRELEGAGLAGTGQESGVNLHGLADVEREAVMKQAEVWRRVEDRIARRVRDE
jgi:hypothetical protein